MDKKYKLTLSHPMREQLVEVVTGLKDFKLEKSSLNNVSTNTSEWNSMKMFNDFRSCLNVSSLSSLSILSRIQKKMGLINIRIFYTKCDISFANGGFLITNKPYITYIEKATQIFGYTAKSYKKKVGLAILKNRLRDKNLKYIFFRTKTAKEGFVNTFRFDQGIVNLVEKKGVCIYPPVLKIIEPNIERFYNCSVIKFLFVSSSFILKGGRELVHAFNRLSNDMPNIELMIIAKKGTIDEESLEIINNNSKIKLLDPMSREVLYREYFSQAHCLVYPTYSDSFSMIINEAISMFMPIITSDFYSIPERVVDGFNGFLFKSPFKNYTNKFIIFEEHFTDKTDIIKTIYCASQAGTLEYVEHFLYDKMKILTQDRALLCRMAEASKKVYENKLNYDKIKKTVNKIFLKAVDKYNY